MGGLSSVDHQLLKTAKCAGNQLVWHTACHSVAAKVKDNPESIATFIASVNEDGFKERLGAAIKNSKSADAWPAIRASIPPAKKTIYEHIVEKNVKEKEEEEQKEKENKKEKEAKEEH